MGWKDLFTTKHPDTQEDTQAKVKVNDQGQVSDFLYGVENDTDTESGHSHVWGLDSDNDEDIGGRPPADED